VAATLVAPGRVLAGRFEIERLAGVGGTSTVLRARDRESGAPVAIKVLTGAGVADLAREAAHLSDLRHPGVARFVDLFEDEHSRFLVIEWIDGESLAAALDRGPLGVPETLRLAGRLASALGAAHRAGIVHGDVTPRNVLLRSGRVDDAVLVDFGTARARGGLAPGGPIGTPGYMSPEQARGDRMGPTADIFSLGAVLFECLTGRRAFEAEHAWGAIARALLDDPPSVREVRPEVPDDVARLIARLMSKDPAARPQRGDAVAALLDRPVTPLQREHAAAPATSIQRDADAGAEPFVGRDREVMAIRSEYEACAEERTARVVVVRGDAGVGKSALRRRALADILGGEAPPEIWIARADRMESDSALALLGRTIRGAARIESADAAAIRRGRIEERVGRHVSPDDRTRVVRFVGEIADVAFDDSDFAPLRAARADPVLLGDQMRRAFADWLRAECESRPIALVLEDVHHADAATLRFVDEALGSMGERPLFVLALGRAEGAAKGAMFPHGAATEIRLGSLPRRAAQALARVELGEATGDVARIVERADGNPLVLRELCRAARSGSTELPDTVRAIFESRIALVEPEARRVLGAASVLGRAFWSGGVVHLLSDPGAAAWLPELAGRDIVLRRRTSRFADEAEWAFRHEPIREAAYAAIAASDLALLHGLAGEWLEGAGERDPAVLGAHFDAAGDAARAAPLHLRAAIAALEAHDFASAVVAADRGAAGAAGETLGRLRLVAAEAERWRGDFPRAESLAEEAATLLAPGSAAALRALEETITAAGRRGEYGRALGWRDIDSVPPEAGAVSARVACLCAAARQTFHAARYDVSDEILDRVGVIAFAADDLDPRARAEVHRLRGARARHRGDLGADLHGYLSALGLFETAGDERSACNARVSVGFAWCEVGDFERGRAAFERGLAQAEGMGLGAVVARAKQNLALVHQAAGEWDAARAAATAAIWASSAQGNRRFEGWTRIYLSAIELGAGDAAAAAREAQLAEQLLSLAPPARAAALAARSRALLAMGRTAEALQAARGAMGTLEALGSIEEFESLVRLSFVEAARAAGREEEADAARTDARRRLTERAATIPDEALRQSFLTGIAENARLMSG